MSDNPARPMEEVEVTSVSTVSRMKSGQEAPTDSIRYYGVLKRMGESYGFIECCLTQDLYDRDVYITKSSEMPKGCTVGNAVSFRVRLNHNGRPQATEVRLEPESRNPGRTSTELEAQERKKPSSRYYGVLKSMSPTIQSGFIECLRTYEIFGYDVFVTMWDLPSQCKVGEAVSFEVCFVA